MKKTTLIAVLLMLATAAQAQTFEDFLSKLDATIYPDKPAVIDSFFNAVDRVPWIEGDTLAHYLYYVESNSPNKVQMHGDITQWGRDETPAVTFTRVSGTNLFYASLVHPADSRLDYKYILDDTEWIQDPRNPARAPSGFGPNTELAMPQYPDQPELDVVANAELPQGTITQHDFHSDTLYATALSNALLDTNIADRTLRVYTPAGYDDSSDRLYPMILFHDGFEAQGLGLLHRVLDYLIANELIEPVIAVLAPPLNRTEEYADHSQVTGSLPSYNRAYAAYLADELIPWLMTQYRIDPDRSRHAVSGASYGGNATLTLGLLHSDVFSMIAPQSAYVEPSLLDTIANSAKRDLKIKFQCGTIDFQYLIGLNRDALYPALETAGYEIDTLWINEGHSWGNWRAHWDNILIDFFPYVPSSAPEGTPHGTLPRESQLLPNWPNPFNSSTTLSYSLVRPTSVTLTLFDTLGREVLTLDAGKRTAGVHRVPLLADRLASGVYFAELTTPLSREVQKITLLR